MDSLRSSAYSNRLHLYFSRLPSSLLECPPRLLGAPLPPAAERRYRRRSITALVASAAPSAVAADVCRAVERARSSVEGRRRRATPDSAKPPTVVWTGISRDECRPPVSSFCRRARRMSRPVNQRRLLTGGDDLKRSSYSERTTSTVSVSGQVSSLGNLLAVS